MSEKRHDHIEQLEQVSAEQGRAERHEHEVNRAEAEANQAKELEAARSEVAHESSSAEKDKILEKLQLEQAEEKNESVVNAPPSSELKKTTLKKELVHIRHKLSGPDKLGSKIIHQRLIRNVSEVSAKTITRPSGLLGGGITAFLGTSIYLYLTKHIGLKYNYSMFLFLLIAGFILGLVIEALIRLARGRRTV